MKLNILVAAIALAFAGAASAQSTTPPAADRKADTSTRADRAPASERKVKDAEEDKIEAQAKADKAKCDGMQGNAKDVCQKEAKAKEKLAKAELDAQKNPSERNQRKVKEAKAEGEYEVAKEKCDDMKGKEKDACQKEAKAMRDRAKAEIKGDSKTASRGATTEPRPAAPANRPAPAERKQQ